MCGAIAEIAEVARREWPGPALPSRLPSAIRLGPRHARAEGRKRESGHCPSLASAEAEPLRETRCCQRACPSDSAPGCWLRPANRGRVPFWAGCLDAPRVAEAHKRQHLGAIRPGFARCLCIAVARRSPKGGSGRKAPRRKAPRRKAPRRKAPRRKALPAGLRERDDLVTVDEEQRRSDGTERETPEFRDSLAIRLELPAVGIHFGVE
jgi:hypothetical protein